MEPEAKPAPRAPGAGLREVLKQKGASDAFRLSERRGSPHAELRDELFSLDDEWERAQQRKIYLIDTMLESGLVGRPLEQAERTSLEEMRRHLELELTESADQQSAAANEGNVSLTAEQRSALYGAAERKHAAQDDSRAAALEKSRVLRQFFSEQEGKDRLHNRWLASQRAIVAKRRDELKDLDARTDKAEALTTQIRDMVANIQCTVWQYEELKKWSLTQLPVLTPEEQQMLKGTEIIRRIRNSRAICVSELQGLRS